MTDDHYVDVELGKALAQRWLINGSLDGKTRLAPCVSVCSSGDRIVREKNVNLALVMAIALVIASKKLQRHTGVAAEDWRKELMEQALEKFNRMSVGQLEKFIAENFGTLE